MDNEKDIAGTSSWPFERRCPECGKIFVFGGTMMDDWAYKDRGQYLCSWKCLRSREKKRADADLKAAEKKARLKKLTPAQKEGLIRQKIFRGMTNEEISAEIGMSTQLVNYYRKKLEEAFKG